MFAVLFCSLRGAKKCSLWDKWSQTPRWKIEVADRTNVGLGFCHVIPSLFLDSPGLARSVRLQLGEH